MTGEKTISLVRVLSISINFTPCQTEPKINMLISFITEKLPEEFLSPWNTKEHPWEETKDMEDNNKVGVKTKDGDSHLKTKDGETNPQIMDGVTIKEDGEEVTTAGESLIDVG